MSMTPADTYNRTDTDGSKISREGISGPWATFNITIGTPPQPLRLGVSLIDSEIIAATDNTTLYKCPASLSPHCPSLLNVNASSTWSSRSLIEVTGANGTDMEGMCGLDDISLGSLGAAGITLQSQALCGSDVKYDTIGSLRLNPYPQNLSGFDQDIAFLSSLKQSNHMPSLSFRLSIGAQYRQYLRVH